MQMKLNRTGGHSGGGGGMNDFTEQYIMIVFTEDGYILLVDLDGNTRHEYFAGHRVRGCDEFRVSN